MHVCLHPRRHCGKPPYDTPKYGLLFAAQAGCLQCVKYWVEDMNVDVRSASDNPGIWDAEYYAQWGGSAGQEFLFAILASSQKEGLPRSSRRR